MVQQPALDLHFADAESRACSQLYKDIAAKAAAEQLSDPVYQPIPGAAFLRSDRFLASFSQQLDSPEKYRHWLEALNRNAREALAIEWQRLGRKPALRSIHNLAALEQELHRCGEVLLGALLEQPLAAIKPKLQQASRSASLYRSWTKPLANLMAPSLRRSVHKEHQHQRLRERNRQGRGNPIFDAGLKNHHIYGSPRRFPAKTAQQIVAKLPRDSLGIPRLSHTLEQQLLDVYRPYWAVNSGANNDIPGALLASMHGPQVDTNQLSQYRYTSFSRWQDEVILQLNYVVWFSRRNANPGIDLLAGELDGLVWRVYLKADGNVLAYDAIHNCGCWYQLYLNPSYATPRRQNPKDEPAFVSQFWPGSVPPLLLLEPNSHQLIRPIQTGEWGLYKLAKLGLEQLRQRSYKELRRQPVFNDKGIIDSSHRLERFILWPSGVPSPGAMRIRNHHIIAFVGERYFDQPDLLQSLAVQKQESD